MKSICLCVVAAISVIHSVSGQFQWPFLGFGAPGLQQQQPQPPGPPRPANLPTLPNITINGFDPFFNGLSFLLTNGFANSLFNLVMGRPEKPNPIRSSNYPNNQNGIGGVQPNPTNPYGQWNPLPYQLPGQIGQPNQIAYGQNAPTSYGSYGQNVPSSYGPYGQPPAPDAATGTNVNAVMASLLNKKQSGQTVGTNNQYGLPYNGQTAMPTNNPIYPPSNTSTTGPVANGPSGVYGNNLITTIINKKQIAATNGPYPLPPIVTQSSTLPPTTTGISPLPGTNQTIASNALPVEGVEVEE